VPTTPTAEAKNKLHCCEEIIVCTGTGKLFFGRRQRCEDKHD
jgi:hypothetical protein